jgi:uncharacterized protein with HEPN domain
MPKREDFLLLNDIVLSGEKIFNYTGKISFESFLENAMMIDAVVRNLEIIGEASKMVSEETKSAQPEIEWRRMAQFRDVLIHDYFGIEYEIVWDVLKNHLPPNIDFIRQIIDNARPSDIL